MAKGKPRIMAVYGVRYEPQWLVDELRKNLSWVDELVVVDDRGRKGELWVHEAKYRQMQRNALIKAGIRPWDHVLVTSPDERWSDNAEEVIRPLIERRSRTIYRFPLREMWSPTRFRTDGMWGRKTRPRLYPFLPGQRHHQGRIQTAPTPLGSYRRRSVPSVSIYHLESIHPASRAERAIVYEAMSPGSQRRASRSQHWARFDPERRYMRKYGFAYLADPRGARLAAVPRQRGFTPPVTEPYLFRVPDELLLKECGKTRAQLEAWLTRTLGVTRADLKLPT